MTNNVNISDAFPMLKLKNMGGTDWKAINWKRCTKHVNRIQFSISKASKFGDHKRVRVLQRILWNSKSTILIGIKKVTQDNRGRKTAGVDGIIVLTPKERSELASKIKVFSKWNKVKQVEIPKKNGSIRTLGIPTINDRAKQAIIKMGLEPGYETIAEPNSYGFRPGRSCHDGIGAIFLSLKGQAGKAKEKFVIEGDLKGFFDNINPKAILENDLIKDNPELRESIRKLINSGAVTVKGDEITTDKGTPQGGVISPLLANIAFTGLETFIKDWAWERRKSLNVKCKRDINIQVIIYADDFVILTKDKWIAEELKTDIEKWCKTKMGVELSKEKTHITSTLKGFDFLGFNCRHYEVGNKLKTIIKPAKKSIEGIKEKIRVTVKESKGVSQEVLISKLNPIIRGWGNYYQHVVSKDIYKAIDHYIFECLWGWSKKRHNNKCKTFIKEKYFKRSGNRNWVFMSGKYRLVNLADIKIVRHIKIKSNAQIYDNNTEYWKIRTKKSICKSNIWNKLFVKQKSICAICEGLFHINDKIELDHIIPKSRGGKEEIKNYQLVHNHCHDRKTSQDGSLNKN